MVGDLGVTRLTAETAAGNRASEIVLERNGFNREGWRDDPRGRAVDPVGKVDRRRHA